MTDYMKKAANLAYQDMSPVRALIRQSTDTSPRAHALSKRAKA